MVPFVVPEHEPVKLPILVRQEQMVDACNLVVGNSEPVQVQPPLECKMAKISIPQMALEPNTVGMVDRTSN
jgi:hypothetical protein